MLFAAWGGAALFVASLGYFAWFYLVALGTAPPAPTGSVPVAIAINATLFSVFALHHSAFARTGAKAWVARHLPPGLERSAYVWLASLLFLAVCLLWRPIPGIAWQAPGLTRWLLYAVQMAGILVTLQSASRIDIWDLAGVRQARAARRPSPSVRSVASPDVPSAQFAQSADAPSAQSTLEIRGPYRWLRHPIYFGWVLLVFGTPTMTNGRLLFAAISALYLVVAIPLEERSLHGEFGPAYRRYQQQVRWRLIPGVW